MRWPLLSVFLAGCPVVAPHPTTPSPPSRTATAQPSPLESEAPTQAPAAPTQACVDTDGDRVPEADDGCPTEAETYNGVDDDDGCPDPSGVWVTASETGLSVPPIRFELDDPELAVASRPIVDAVARYLLRHDEITRVEIAVHSAAIDEQGHYGRNLTELRAVTLRDYLVEQGVAPERLEAHGYEDTRPLVPETNAAARLQNRRVEWVLRQVGEDCPPSRNPTQ